MIKLRIKYGNSQTVLRFPCTEKEMSAALGRIHAENITPLELYAAEVVFPEELSFLKTDSLIWMKSTSLPSGWTASSATRNIGFTRR